jgi:hypothetical protein
MPRKKRGPAHRAEPIVPPERYSAGSSPTSHCRCIWCGWRVWAAVALVIIIVAIIFYTNSPFSLSTDVAGAYLMPIKDPSNASRHIVTMVVPVTFANEGAQPGGVYDAFLMVQVDSGRPRLFLALNEVDVVKMSTEDCRQQTRYYKPFTSFDLLPFQRTTRTIHFVPDSSDQNPLELVSGTYKADLFVRAKGVNAERLTSFTLNIGSQNLASVNACG